MTNLRHFLPFIYTLFGLSLFAEGTRELAPNPQIFINGNATNDIAALYIGEPRFNNFASFSNVNPTSRLHIHIADPSSECLYLGLSAGTLNTTGSSTNFIDYEYRVVDPAGNVVFGPFTITPGNAQIRDWLDGYTGPRPLHGPNGYVPEVISSADLMSRGWSGSGNYYIEFNPINTSMPLLINYWDLTVVDCSSSPEVEKKGRVWSNNWALFAINDFDFPNRPFNGAFYICAPDPSDPDNAFITKVDFNGSGFRPAAFNVAFNSYGTANTGMISEDRKSQEGGNFTTPEYEIFLNDPVDLCQTANTGEIELLGISRCSMLDFCIKFVSTKEGQIDLLLDFDGPDGMFTPGTADRIITTSVSSAQAGKPFCLDWDGRDGLGNMLPESGSTEIPIVISYAQGIYHFPIYDAELLTTGFQISAIRPAGPSPKLYYDDSNISVSSGTGEPAVQLNGCTLPCHAWTNYVDGATMGFGNLNTINSWWFSAQVVTQEVFLLPGYYDCFIETQELCPGDTLSLSAEIQLFPLDAEDPDIISQVWSGNGIVGNNIGDTIQITESGIYDVTITYINATGDTCSTACSGEVLAGQQVTSFIDTLIVKGDTVQIGQERYTQAGRYTQLRTSPGSCDSLLIIDVVVAQTTLLYDFNDCRSYKADSTHANYEEFVVKYPEPLSCADIDAEFLRRENPFVNPHSCTPGVNGSPAMCVGSLDTCFYDAGNQKSIIFEVNVSPDPDTAILITQLRFYERAPEMFDWIDGISGPNNYPTLYGIRILKDGNEVYRLIDIPTQRNWNERAYELASIPEMRIEEDAVIRFELLPYCTLTDSIEVNAWDIDELTVAMACAPKLGSITRLEGQLQTAYGDFLSRREVTISQSFFAQYQTTQTTNTGQYAFMNLLNQEDIYLQVADVEDDMNGINMKDVIYLYRHLLGRSFLTTQPQEVAADINLDGHVNIRDLAYLRRMVVGLYDELPESSWVYGLYDSDEDIFNPEMVIPFKNGPIIQDLTGIKIGDLDGTAVVGLEENETRSVPTHPVSVEDQFLERGQEINLHLLIKSTDLVGANLSLKLSGMEWQGLDGSSSEGWIYHMDEDQLNANWIGEGEDIVSLTLQLRATKSGMLSKSLSWSEEQFSLIYSGEELQESQLAFEWDSQEKETSFAVYPNPSTGMIYLEGLPDTYRIRIMDISGRSADWSGHGQQLTIKEKGLFLIEVSTPYEKFVEKIWIR